LTWEERYSVESEIGYLQSGDRLRQEIARHLRRAKADRVPEADALENAYLALLNQTGPSNPPNPLNPPNPSNPTGPSKSPAPATSSDPETPPTSANPPVPANPPEPLNSTDDVLRGFLLEVMETIHAHRRRKYIVGKLQAEAARKTLILISIVLLVVFSFIVLSGKTDVRLTSVASLNKDIGVPIALFGNNDFWPHFAFYTVAIFGLLGALFSRLLSILRPSSIPVLDELYNAATYGYIFRRSIIGIVGAVVVYFFLQSGLVEGSVFPKFDQLAMKSISFASSAERWPTTLLLPSSSLALLIMWSIIAGFSESLVPTILENVGRQFGGAINSRQQA
jgi:hypothetical protein